MKKEYDKVLTIAGSDPSGGAGIQADIKTLSALGCYGASAITAITVQNTMGVRDLFPIPASIVKEQIEAVMDDLRPCVIKIGMLCNDDIVRIVADCINRYNPKWVVLDTVIISTSGHRLLSEKACRTMINELIPLASVITPNLPEADAIIASSLELISQKNSNILLNEEEFSVNEKEVHQIEKLKLLSQFGAKSVLLKGGHQNGDVLKDFFIEDGKIIEIHNKRVPTNNTHGTGCTLSSAIAAFLAKRYSLEDAVIAAEAYLQNAIISGADIKTGEGCGPVNFFFSK